MPVFRVHKNKDNPYVTINKTYIYDSRLSLKAKGLMSYFLSRPDNWEFYSTEIVKHTTDKETSIATGIKELLKNGYIKRYTKRDKSGKFQGGYDYEIYEVPIEDRNEKIPNGFNPYSGEIPFGKKPIRENQVLLNNEFNNKNKEHSTLQVYTDNISKTPGKLDIEILNKWINKLGEDIVVFAINVATKANIKRLSYIETILTDWEKQRIETVEQAVNYIGNRNKKKTKSTRKEKVDSFNDYEQRTYDYEELEKKLLGWDKGEEE